MNPFRLALLGAPGTGKTRLAIELAAALARQVPAPGARSFMIEDNPLPAAIAGAVTSSASTQVPRSLSLAAFDLILLMGLDLDGCELQIEADDAIRQTLADGALAYRVIYGNGEERLRNALLAFSSARPRSPPRNPDAPGPVTRSEASRWTWQCDKCSDPVCEHALFTQLESSRARQAA